MSRIVGQDLVEETVEHLLEVPALRTAMLAWVQSQVTFDTSGAVTGEQEDKLSLLQVLWFQNLLARCQTQLIDPA
jgi:hypothetical protein